MKLTQLLKILACPNCQSEHLFIKSVGEIVCPSCSQTYPIKNNIPIFLTETISSHETDQINYFNQHYGSFTENKLILEPWRQSMIQRVFPKNLSNGETYLDIGCGASGYTVFESIRCGYKLGIGIDLSFTAISKVTKLSQHLKLDNSTFFMVASFEKLPFRKKVFDYVSAISVLEHTNDDKPSTREINRILKPNRFVFICVPNSYKNIWFFLRPIYRIIDRMSGHKRHYSLADLKKLLGNHFSISSYVYNGHLIKIIQMILTKFRIINSDTWWKLEKMDFSKYPQSLQLNTIFKKHV